MNLFDTPTSRVLDALSRSSRQSFEKLLNAPQLCSDELKQRITDYSARLEEHSRLDEFFDNRTAAIVERKSRALLDRLDNADGLQRKLIQAAILYFVEEDDAENDLSSPIGFDDDLEVVDAVARELGFDDILEIREGEDR